MSRKSIREVRGASRAALWQARLEREAQIRDALLRRPLGAPLVRVALEALLRVAGLWNRGVRNANSPLVVREQFRCPRLPKGFDGLRVLFVSDFHFSGRPGFLEMIDRVLGPLRADLCILGGDFQWNISHDSNWARRGLDILMPILCGRYGAVAILGNNDSSETADVLRGHGVRVLVNEAYKLRNGADAIWLAGVDDPHDFQCDSVEEALRGIPEDAFTLLLAHSPEAALEAARAGVDVYLCGHTHAGQILLPRVGAIRINTRAPRQRCHGRWRIGALDGYTSAGIGTTAVPVRFNCPPEIALLEFVRETRRR